MTAEVIGNAAGVPILWEQLSGVPVNYTSALNGLTITFTTTDLGQKRFKVCTNPNTPNEYCSEAIFFHYPADTVQPLTAVPPTSVSDFPVFKSELFTAYYQQGLIPNGSTVTDFVDMDAPIDGFSELRVINHNSVEANRIILNIKYQKQVAGTWITVLDAGTELVFSVPNLDATATNYRLLIDTYRYGIRTEYIVPFVDFVAGFEDKLKPSQSASPTSVSNLQTSIQFRVALSNSDVIRGMHGAIPTSVANLNTVLQYRNSLSSSDIIEPITAVAHTSVSQLVITIQTNTGVI